MMHIDKAFKIVSGAQTGVDRAALDAAMACGIETGGWCPEGRKAEDGIIPDKYAVTVLPGADYIQRTRRNVIDSDATLIVYFDKLSGGTERTVDFCIKENKLYLLIDAADIVVERAVEIVAAFLSANSIAVLNVAGPRASGEPGGYEYTRRLLQQVFESQRNP